MTRAIAKRQGRPAHEDAPPRLRQSHIPKPFIPAKPMHEDRCWVARIFGRNR